MSTFTTTDGCTIDYRVDGPADAADTLVLLHGWSQSRAMFDRALPALSTTYQVITYDQRGHGESGKPDRGARIARLVADLHELLDHLAWRRRTWPGTRWAPRCCGATSTRTAHRGSTR